MKRGCCNRRNQRNRAAISIELSNSGYKVAAVFAGNEEAATLFNKEHGIPVYKIDVSDFNACQVGIAEIESEVGSVDILVNNAGITRDGTMHRMTPENWQAVIDTNLVGCFNKGVASSMNESGNLDVL